MKKSILEIYYSHHHSSINILIVLVKHIIHLFLYFTKMGNMKLCSFMLCLFIAFFLLGATAQNCGSQVAGALCPNGLCCSKFGWCGESDTHCGAGCQSQCRNGSTPTPTPSGGNISNIITRSQFEEMLKHRNDPACPGHGFYTYDAFIAAAPSCEWLYHRLCQSH